MNKNFTHKKWLKRLFAALCCLSAAFTMQAATITVDGINYTTKSDGTVTVARYTIDKTVTPYDSLFYEGDIVIPEKVAYDGVEYTVVATAANAFADCRDLTSLTKARERGVCQLFQPEAPDYRRRRDTRGDESECLRCHSRSPHRTQKHRVHLYGPRR